MKVVVDRLVQYPNRFQLVNVSTSEVLGVFDLSAVTGTIQQVGTEIDAELFQSIQDDLTQLAQDIVAESNARGVDVQALQDSIATKITANGGELGNGVVTFTEVSNAPNIASGENASTLFGKIRNWFSRLKALAFKDKIADVDISTNANISQSKVSGLTAIQSKLDGIDAGANKYTLPVSTATNLGGVKVGSRLSVATDGTLSADSQTENSYTTTEKNKLAGIESGAQKNAVTSVAGKTGPVTLSKSDVGLGNVDNVKQYSASNPPPYPVTSVNGNTGAVLIDKSSVGLGNVADERQYSASNPPPYEAITGKPTIPTKTSDLNNDSGFLTSVPTATSSRVGGIKVNPSSGGIGTGLTLSNGYLYAQHGPYYLYKSLRRVLAANETFTLSSVLTEMGASEQDLHNSYLDVTLYNLNPTSMFMSTYELKFGTTNTDASYISQVIGSSTNSTLGTGDSSLSKTPWVWKARGSQYKPPISAFPLKFILHTATNSSNATFQIYSEYDGTVPATRSFLNRYVGTSELAFKTGNVIGAIFNISIYKKFGY